MTEDSHSSAARFVTILEGYGAEFVMTPNGDTSMNFAAVKMSVESQTLALMAFLRLIEPIRQICRARLTVH